MAIQFPANPSNGQTFTASNNLVYVYDGEKWITTGSSQAQGDCVLKTGDTMTGDLTVPSLNGGQLAGFRNQIINGSFAVAQRGVDVTPPADANLAGYLTVDRWFHSGQNQNIGRIVRDKSSSSIGAPPGFDYILHFVDASKTSRSGFGQVIELPLTGQRGAFTAGSVWTLSFYVNIDVSGKTVESLTFADDFGGANASICASGAGLSYTEIGSYTNNWKRYSVTYTLNATSPNVTNTCLRVNVGSVTQSGKLAFTGCQLEPGPVATPFEHRPIGTELALCQRYYESFELLTAVLIEVAPSFGLTTKVTFATTKRIKPTVTLPLGIVNLQPGGGSDPGLASFVTVSHAHVSVPYQAGNRIIQGLSPLIADAEL